MADLITTVRGSDAQSSRIGVTVALVCGGLWLAAFLALIPVAVTIDGEPRLVAADTTFAEIAKTEVVRAPRGDILSVEGSVLATGAGGVPRVTVNGRPAPLGQPVWAGAAIASHRGPDVREPVVTVLAAEPPPARYVGKGPDEVIEDLGSPGLLRIQVGEISRGVVTSEQVRPTIPAVYRRQPYPRDAKLVALTFDDGPWPGQTQAILEILKDEGVHATFFMMGLRVQRSPSLARRVAAEGHEIGNHTQTHVMLGHAAPSVVAYQVRTGAKTIKRYTGVQPAWFRAPGGYVTPTVKSEAGAIGERIAGWDVDTRDWQKRQPQELVDAVLNRLQPGSVILMHDGGGDRTATIEALPRIIHKLKGRGYRIVTMSELRAPRR